jgi:flagellar basal-body rod protein FlgC
MDAPGYTTLGRQSGLMREMQVVAQNIANAESTGTREGDEPYRRQTITFKNVMDKEMGTKMVTTNKISTDKAEFDKRYEPANPNADAEGYVLYPNVNPIVEMMDMRESRRGYEANLNVIEASKAMMGQTINLLK